MNSSASSRALLQLEQHVEDLRADGDVEHRDRLVADDPVGLEHERGRDRDALALPARELVRVAAHEALRRHADFVQSSFHARGVLGLRHPGHHQRLGDDGGHAAARVQRLVRVLEDHLDVAAQRAQRRPALAPARRRSRPCPAAAGTSPSIARASVDFPQPDSPTIPRISPRRHSSDTPSSARAGPWRVEKWTERSRDLHERRHPGSSSTTTGSGQRSQGAKWQAADCASATSRSAGSSAQRSAA